jgi:hypothetical protein
MVVRDGALTATGVEDVLARHRAVAAAWASAAG